ncbi:hypothetical protein GTZ99_03025 [Novosphingobium sp. FSY-8]|uniref:Uncharacterized protein n=1 Tax=Novosphingobium ovatum TaxID=1908523 RepID=A0ABW9XAG1_9SPHN|nr:hypothetical protein [Novosphingobium ovatum]NBC35524.1 hypothetical protein [Novosphingobium ovatum]
MIDTAAMAPPVNPAIDRMERQIAAMRHMAVAAYRAALMLAATLAALLIIIHACRMWPWAAPVMQGAGLTMAIAAYATALIRGRGR